MNIRRLAVLGLALGCAASAGILAKNMVNNKPSAEVVEVNKVPMVDILVASKDMAMGEKLIESTVNWREWPKSGVSEAMITKDAVPDALVKYQTARARLPIFNGEPIVDKKLVIPGQTGFMSALLPKGMRAISVAISERSAAGGFILPNDRVDVILTRKVDDAGGGPKVVKSETVLSNVKVLAINQIYRQETGEDKVTVTEGKTATLELDASQTEVVAMVESAGELSLALRSIAENDGKSLAEQAPRLSDNFRNKKRARGGERLFVRYGVESFTSSR